METPDKTYSTFETIIQIRPDDIDLNRHVHNSKYYDYVLAARYDQMERCYGISMDAFLERGLSWVVRTAHLEHKRALKIGDSALVRTHVAQIKSRSVRVEFEILREADQAVAAEGWFDYIMVALDTGRARMIPEDVVAHYSV